MKKSAALLLAGSVMLNVMLAIVLLIGAARSNDQSPPAAESHRTAATGASGPVIDANLWPELSAGDLPEVVARLRAAGFPPNVLRAIVGAQLQEHYAARRRAIDPAAENRPFWKNNPLDPRTMAAMRQLGREQQKAMRDLLGADAEPDDPMSRARDVRQFGHLSPEKMAEARRIQREFSELRSDIYMSYGGAIAITSVEREKLTAIEKQMKAELAKLMTPEEYENYELRGSNTANSLRYQLAAFDASEAEFRSLFQLQRSFDERFGQLYSQPSPEEMRLRSEAQRQLTDQIRAALGPARAAEYDRATDHEYRTMTQLVARLDLPAETTTKAWAVRDEMQRRANEAYKDSTLPPDQRAQRLAALQKEGIERLTPILGGSRGIEAYRQYGGQWLENLVPRTRTPTR